MLGLEISRLECLKVMSLGNRGEKRKKSIKDLTQVVGNPSGPHLIHLLSAEVSQEMISVEG